MLFVLADINWYIFLDSFVVKISKESLPLSVLFQNNTLYILAVWLSKTLTSLVFFSFQFFCAVFLLMP